MLGCYSLNCWTLALDKCGLTHTTIAIVYSYYFSELLHSRKASITSAYGLSMMHLTLYYIAISNHPLYYEPDRRSFLIFIFTWIVIIIGIRISKENPLYWQLTRRACAVAAADSRRLLTCKVQCTYLLIRVSLH